MYVHILFAGFKHLQASPIPTSTSYFLICFHCSIAIKFFPFNFYPFPIPQRNNLYALYCLVNYAAFLPKSCPLPPWRILSIHMSIPLTSQISNTSFLKWFSIYYFGYFPPICLRRTIFILVLYALSSCNYFSFDDCIVHLYRYVFFHCLASCLRRYFLRRVSPSSTNLSSYRTFAGILLEHSVLFLSRIVDIPALWRVAQWLEGPKTPSFRILC